jgi:kumamolisin
MVNVNAPDHDKMHPYFKFYKTHASTALKESPWVISNICHAYNWPSKLKGGGVIGIVELGGGWTASDLQKFCYRTHQPVPKVTDVSVDGTKNAPGGDADIEVALDIQMAATAYFQATGHAATIKIFWAQDIASAVREATATGCDVCSISWGADEADWGKAAANDMQSAALAATTAGMIVFAASGDNDSSDGGTTPANVDLPASAPNVVGCGGTSKETSATSNLEVVWNNNPNDADGSGTGGGYSTMFNMPTWQIGAPNSKFRMVPDISANADPNTGYHIVYQGEDMVVGGTSAVAPLYAGLFAAFGTKLGFITPTLWSHPIAFNDITSGNNGQWKALVGPDPCTGLGSPIGTQIAKLFVKS